MLMISAGNSSTMWSIIKAYNNTTPAAPVPRSCWRSAVVSPEAAWPTASCTGCDEEADRDEHRDRDDHGKDLQ